LHKGSLEKGSVKKIENFMTRPPKFRILCKQRLGVGGSVTKQIHPLNKEIYYEKTIL